MRQGPDKDRERSAAGLPIATVLPLACKAVLLAAILASATPAQSAENAAGLVDIGGGRKMYLECRGTGTPTVVLIAGGWEAGWIWTYSTSAPIAAGQEALEIDGGIDAILNLPPAPQMPVILFTADKLARDAPASRRAELIEAHGRLASQLGARHATDTASGHHIHVERPQLVTEAIREVVDAVRAGKNVMRP